MKCGYIAGGIAVDDHLAKIRRGESPFCDKPVTRGSFCAEHAELCLAGVPKPKKRAYSGRTGRDKGTDRWGGGRVGGA